MNKRIATRAFIGTIGVICLTSCGSDTPAPVGRIESPREQPVVSILNELATDLVTGAAPGFDPRPTETTEPGEPAVVSDADRVAWAFAGLMETRRECSHDPWNCDVDALAIPGSAIHSSLDELMQRRRRYGIVASDRGSTRYRLDAIDVVAPGVAQVSVCITDDTVLTMAPPGGGPRAIYDESMTSSRSVVEMRETSAGWRWTTQETIENRMGEDVCALS